MNDFDEDVKKAMADEGSPAVDLAREPSFREMVASSFRGRNRWMTIMVWVFLWVFTGLAVFAAVQFFRMDGLADKLMYATIFLALCLSAGMMKMWYWMLMNRNALAREIKRLELRIAELQASVEKR